MKKATAKETAKALKKIRRANLKAAKLAKLEEARKDAKRFPGMRVNLDKYGNLTYWYSC